MRLPAYLLDTGVTASILRRANERVLRRLVKVAPGEVGISAITRGELEWGVRMSRCAEQDETAVDWFLEHVGVLEYPGEAAPHYAEIRETLHWKEVQMSVPDLLVAAHTRCLGLTLVTERPREFGKVPGLVVECWSE